MVASADLPPHVTSTLPFPSGWVCWEISQVQVTVPLASAVLGSSPVAVLVLPEGWVKTMEQDAPGDVCTLIMAFWPAETGDVSEAILVAPGDPLVPVLSGGSTVKVA